MVTFEWQMFFMDTALIEEKSIIVANVLDELLFKDRSGLLSEF